MKLIILLLLSTVCYSQGELKYQYKNEPFPYDSGVAISDQQYQYLLRSQLYGEIQQKTQLQPPKIVIQTKEVRKKGDGSKGLWAGIGIAIGVIITVFATKI